MSKCIQFMAPFPTFHLFYVYICVYIKVFTFPFTCKHFFQYSTDSEQKNPFYITGSNKELMFLR